MSHYKKMYKEIWEDRKQMDFDGSEYVECVNKDLYEDCKQRIYESELNVWHFAHIESKGAAPHKKYDKNNVDIKCAGCHGTEHASGKFNNYTGIK